MRKEKTSKLQNMTKGQIEAEVSNALVAFEKDHMGRGPVDARTYIIQDMVMIRLKGVLTRAERNLAHDDEGIQLIKQVRQKLIESSTQLLGDIIKDKTGCEITSIHSDISTRTGERFIIITLTEDLEGKLSLRN
jgi:uncharacterized protein YbcI